jgi:hypothetical protein
MDWGMTEAREHAGRETRVVALPGGLASAGLAYDFPGVVEFQVLSVSFKLVTAGGGGARQVLAGLKDSTGADVFSVAAPATQAGGLTVVYSFAGWTPGFGSGALGRIGGPFIASKIAENLTLVASVSGFGAGDVISAARLLVRQWPRAVGYPAIASAA